MQRNGGTRQQHLVFEVKIGRGHDRIKGREMKTQHEEGPQKSYLTNGRSSTITDCKSLFAVMQRDLERKDWWQ